MRVHANGWLLQFFVLPKGCLAQLARSGSGYSTISISDGSGSESGDPPQTGTSPPPTGTSTPLSTTMTGANPVDDGSTITTESPTPHPSNNSPTSPTSSSTATQTSEIQVDRGNTSVTVYGSTGASPSSNALTSQTSTSISLTSSPPLSSTGPFTPAQNTSHHLSGGAIAGIVTGSVVGASFLILALFLLLWWRRSAQTARDRLGQVDPFVDPFVDTSEQGRGERDPPSSSGSGEETREKSEGIPAPRDGKGIPPTISPQSGSVNPSNAINSSGPIPLTSEPDMRNGGAGTDEIIRLFEGRRFEDAILRLISQRMDPPPSLRVQQDGDGPNMAESGNKVDDELPAYTRPRDDRR